MIKPLGAHLTTGGADFAVYSHHAHAVDLVLFERPTNKTPSAVVPMAPTDRYHWEAHIPGAQAGLIYSLRAHGPWDPNHGHRFNSDRLLVDPYARAITATADHTTLQRTLPHAKRPPVLAHLPRAILVDEAFDWQGDVHPDIAWSETIIYETHVKGLTAHPSSRAQHPGTYLGVIDCIPYFQDLGITALEFLPVHHCQSEAAVLARGQTNYWGYMTLGYFAPDRRFCSSLDLDAPVKEFKTMVRALHQAGIEVILDVVYNHTCEGPADGPTLSWRGLDNRAFYALSD
ncbi:MAG TPA: alpha-amylase family glycosyl hydrolase, partial [Candidatus Xenobia bacterium]